MKKLSKASYGRKNERGMVLVVVLIIISILILIGSFNVMTSLTDLKISSNYKLGTQAFYAAEAGIEYGYIKLVDALQLLNPTINITAPTISGCTFDTFSVQAVSSQQLGIIGGTYEGLTAYITDYQITSEARVTGTNASAKIDLVVKDNLIPIFQFGIFYQNDLEILPGANMVFTGGRIHSNKNIYLNADSGTLSIDSKISSAGDIIHGHKDGRSYSTGNTVQIKDGSGVYQSMNIDSNSSGWATNALDRWDGRVQSQDMGVKVLNVPTTTGEPRDLIGMGEGSMYEKAGLRIIDGVAMDKNGNILDLTYYDAGTMTYVNPVSTKSFTDKREGKVVTVTEVDIDKLQKSSAAMSALNNPPSGSDPGILYVNQTDNSKSVRLTNGASIPSTGLTVASNNPVYIKGDYNTAGYPAAILGDAITVLSNSWNDANSGTSNVNDRTASNTTVRAGFMGGNVEQAAGSSYYSGGAENYMRLLENWSGKTLTYSGSLVCLWQSNQAVGRWNYGSPYYTAPTRNWSYGMDPANLPPGTPRVRGVDKYTWRQNM